MDSCIEEQPYVSAPGVVDLPSIDGSFFLLSLYFCNHSQVHLLSARFLPVLQTPCCLPVVGWNRASDGDCGSWARWYMAAGTFVEGGMVRERDQTIEKV